MRSSRGMGDINPSKMPKAKKVQRRDKSTFTEVAQKPKTKQRRDRTAFLRI